MDPACSCRLQSKKCPKYGRLGRLYCAGKWQSFIRESPTLIIADAIIGRMVHQTVWNAVLRQSTLITANLGGLAMGNRGFQAPATMEVDLLRVHL
jgi:hypothetical protein